MSKDFLWSTPLVLNDMLYIGGTSFKPDQTGGLLALRIVDGKLPLPEDDIQLFSVVDTLEASGDWSGVASSPVEASGLIYFGGLDGKLYAVNALP
jgi:outer membrane protein assembly factor BamB